MKKMILALVLSALLLTLAGCTSVEGALHEAGDRIAANRLDTPQNSGGDIDWSFVPVLREKATQTFADGFPEAVVKESSVASKNGDSRRVIVTLTYEMNGKTGTYGFDYEKGEDGAYALKRYGDGVSSDDL